MGTILPNDRFIFVKALGHGVIKGSTKFAFCLNPKAVGQQRSSLRLLRGVTGVSRGQGADGRPATGGRIEDLGAVERAAGEVEAAGQRTDSRNANSSAVNSSA